MEKLLSFIRLEFVDGSRTKYGLLLGGILLFLHDAGIVSPEIWETITQYAPFVLGYFGIEHLDKYFIKKKK